MDIRAVTKLAKELIVELTGHPFDAVGLCEKQEAGWRMELDVIESKARIGDDDLVTTYELALDAEGGLTSYRRLRRKRRFDDSASAA